MESGKPRSKLRFFFKGQAVHALFLIALLPVTFALAAEELTTGEGRWLGIVEEVWFAAAIGVAIAHQVYVWFAWRSQLQWKLFTRLFGKADLVVYLIPFYFFLLLRPVLITGLAFADAGSLILPPMLRVVLATVLAIPAAYTGMSIVRYFGFVRAAGADHFRDEYRTMPFVREGAFAWSPNAMYTFAFLGLWSIALLVGSHLALVATLFQHAYIWVHYLSTEKPDMDLLYANE